MIAIASMLITVILLSIVAYVAREYFTLRESNAIDLLFRVVVLVLGVGSIYWRRKSLAKPRLEAVAATAGVLGLIAHLEKSTIQVAIIGTAIACLGFLTTLVTGNELYTYWAGIIAVIVLMFHYPRKALWRSIIETTQSAAKSP